MKAQIENISLSYCVDIKDCKTAEDFERKGKEAQRTMVKMIAEKLLKDKLIDYEASPKFKQGIIILKAEIPVLKKGD